MPVWLIRAFEEVMPRLEAQEAIKAANIAAVASGSMKKQARERIIKSWKREANRGIPTARKPGFRAIAEKFGFAVIEEKKPDE